MAAVGGCGDEDEGLPADPSAATTPVALAVTFRDGAGSRSIARIRCTDGAVRATRWLGAGPSGTLCDEARGLADFLAAEPERTGACTLIYGGPQRARIRGRIGETEIDRSFARRNGCQIADWESVDALLPPLR